MLRSTISLKLACIVALLAPIPATASETITLHTRSRVETSKWIPPEKSHTKLEIPVSERPYTFVYETAEWDPAKTAIVVCDMWNALRNKIPADRVAELAPHMNEVLKAARARGVLIIHAPSGNTDFYDGTPQRARCADAPAVETDPPLKWNYLDETCEAALPIDDSDNGWEGPLLDGRPQTRQHPAIEIGEPDAVGDGKEVYYLLKQRGIENVILMGVHTNMCVLGRPFGIRQLTYLGMNVALMRDMTDSLYNPEMEPKVSHFRGTELVLEHIEKFWCPTVLSTDFTGKPAFRFAGDKRPHVLFIVSDDHYHGDKTMPEFGQRLRENEGIHSTILHGEGGHGIPGTESIASADAVVVYVRRLGLPPEQLAALQAHVKAGKPVLGIRTASHAFKIKFSPDGSYKVPDGQAEWTSFDADILGGNYHGHEANDKESDVRNVDSDHPIMKGVEPATWHSKGSLYNTAPIAEDAVLLQEGTVPDVVEPLTWIREAAPDRGKVFYTALGHPDDFKEPAFHHLLVNAIHWALKK
jgi:nicotinamidase-related amidase/type 1 glutamine amidotransferase